MQNDNGSEDAHPRMATPADVRLLWPEAAASAPTEASALDMSSFAELHPDACPRPSELLLVDVDDDVVSRTIRIVVEEPWVAEEPWDVPISTVTAGHLEVSVHDWDGSDIDPALGETTARWQAEDGVTLRLRAQPAMDDAEISELATSAHLVDGLVDVTGWLGADDAYQVATESAAESHGITYLVLGGTFQLEVVDSYVDPLAAASPGDHVTEVAGRPALLQNFTDGFALSWAPTDGVSARIMPWGDGSDDPEEALRIAESLVPVTVDEPRLVDVWEQRQWKK